MDLSTTAKFTDTRLTLNVVNGAPGTFSIVYGNAMPVLKLASGNWAVDNVQKPSAIQLINGTDTVRLKLGSYSNIITKGKMDLQQSKFLGAKEVIRYQYQFSR
jgi:hypothetical protein